MKKLYIVSYQGDYENGTNEWDTLEEAQKDFEYQKTIWEVCYLAEVITVNVKPRVVC